MSAEATATPQVASAAVDSKAPVQSLATAPVSAQTTGEDKKKNPRKKPVKAEKPTADSAKVAVVKVDFKRAAEDLKGKLTLPSDEMFMVNANKSFNLHTVLATTIDALLKGNDLKDVVALDRKTVLNGMCLSQQITPLLCKKQNKTENATVSTYGNVPTFPDTFESGSTSNYRLFGFLKYPIIMGQRWAAVKYNTFLLVMNTETFRKLLNGELLEDKQVTIIG